MATVTIPLLLKDVTGGVRRAEVEGSTLAEIVDALDRLYPGIARRLCDGGRFSTTVAITVDGKIAVQGPATPVRSDSQIHILPSFGGG